jgi:hypothetical protein
MSKYGRGLNREIVAAINSGIIQEPFSVAQIMKLIKIKQWNPQPSLLDINVNLSNASSKVQSPTDEKYYPEPASILTLLARRSIGFHIASPFPSTLHKSLHYSMMRFEGTLSPGIVLYCGQTDPRKQSLSGGYRTVLFDKGLDILYTGKPIFSTNWQGGPEECRSANTTRIV